MRPIGRFFSSTLLILVFSSGAGATSLPALPTLSFESGFPVYRRQLRQAYSAVQARPRSADANGRLGMVLDAYEQYGAAAICYRRAHLLAPGVFRWTYYLGFAELKQGLYKEAAGTLRAALKLNPDYLPAKLNLAESLLSAGQFEESGRLFREILESHPDAAQAHYGLGRFHAARGDETSAAASFRKACELFPAYGAAHYALALAYRKLGQPQEAPPHFAAYQANVTAIPPQPDPLRAAVVELNRGPLVHLQRGVALSGAGDLEGAIREHETALEIDPKDPQAHINLISLYARAGRPDKAEQEYRAAVALDAGRADCYYNFGVLVVGLKRYQEAEEAFRRALQINPYYAEAHNNLGYLLEQKGRLDEALAEFKKAVENRPDFRLAHFHLGRILVNQGKYTEGIEELHKTIAPEDEDTPAYLYALGAAYGRSGDLRKALLYIRQARESAVARGQTELLAGIDKDLQALEQEHGRPQ